MNTKQSFTTVLTLMLILIAAETAWPRSGITLLLPSDARAFGMAEAYIAESGRPECMHYNIAGTGSIEEGRQYASVSYLSAIDTDKFGIIGYCKSSKNWIVSGGIKYFNAGTMDLYNKYIQKIGTVVSQKDYLVSLGISKRDKFSWTFFRSVSYGIRLKMLKSTLIDKFSAQSFSADIGLLFASKKSSIGVLIGNVGQKMTYNKEGDSLPRYYALGYSRKLFKLANKELFLNADFLIYDDIGGKNNIGLSSEITPQFELRCGYRMGYDLDSLTFGFGYNFKNNCQFDYGISLMGEVGQRHLISVSYRLK